MINRYLGLTVAALTLVCVFLLLKDQSRLPQAKAWLEAAAAQQRASADSHAYLVAIGLNAPVDQTPESWGKARIAAYHAGQEQPTSDFLIPEHALLCPVALVKCREALQSLDLAQAQQLLAEHALVQQRYLELLVLDDFGSALDPALDEPLPDYRVLLRGAQLQALEHRIRAMQGQGAAVEQQLRSEIEAARLQLRRADNLIGKIVWVNLFAQQVDTLADLHRLQLGVSAAPLAELGMQQQNFLPVLQREFSAMARATDGLLVQLPWLSRIFYKPQHTQNLIFLHYQAVFENAELSAADFSRSIADASPVQSHVLGRLNNAIGVVLAQSAGPDLNLYTARMHDLQGKLRLFNLLQHIPAGTALEELSLSGLPASGNPYYPEQPAYWDAANGQLCYRGPLADEARIRCLNVATYASPGSSKER